MNWIAQMVEDDQWRNRLDLFPPEPITLRMTRGRYIASMWWRSRIDLFAHHMGMRTLAGVYGDDSAFGILTPWQAVSIVNPIGSGQEE